MDEAIIKVIRFFAANRGMGVGEARDKIVDAGVNRAQVDHCLEWLQTVSGCRSPEEFSRNMVEVPAARRWVAFGHGLNLTRSAYDLLTGLRGLGVINEDRFEDVLRNVFQLQDRVDVGELQDVLLHDAYERMGGGGETIFIEEQSRWESKN